MRIGDPVTYHGSITYLHGPATYQGPCTCNPCLYKVIFEDRATDRSSLQTDDGDEIHHVRRISYTRA